MQVDAVAGYDVNLVLAVAPGEVIREWCRRLFFLHSTSAGLL